jgi:hypothetical protein
MSPITNIFKNLVSYPKKAISKKILDSNLFQPMEVFFPEANTKEGMLEELSHHFNETYSLENQNFKNQCIRKSVISIGRGYFLTQCPKTKPSIEPTLQYKPGETNIIFANHQAYADIAIVNRMMKQFYSNNGLKKQDLYWIGKSELPTFLASGGVIPISRNPKHGRNTLKTLPRFLEQILEQKRDLVIFPTGKRADTLNGIESMDPGIQTVLKLVSKDKSTIPVHFMGINLDPKNPNQYNKMPKLNNLHVGLGHTTPLHELIGMKKEDYDSYCKGKLISLINH